MIPVIGKPRFAPLVDEHHCSAMSRRDERLDAFVPEQRAIVRDFASRSSALLDLADSFPALLFALATGYATLPKRERAIVLICAGEPLREAAEVLGVAWWMRKLPPQAFACPLPELPNDADFSLRISSLMPQDAARASCWLTRVGHACEAAGPAYALWLARHSELSGPPDDFFKFMAAWAWFSGRPGHLGHRLLRRPWSADMSFKRAREELAAWRHRVRLIECLGPGIERPWLSDGKASGFDFVALRTVDDFIAESEALDNCLDQYADQLYSGLTAVFSIRKGARRVACVEIGLHEEEVTMPTIVQLRGARNRRAAPELWQATFAWLGGQPLVPLSPGDHLPKPLRRAATRRELWGPYLAFLSSTSHAKAFRRAIVDRCISRRGLVRRRLVPMPRPAPALERSHAVPRRG
jgi:PcfJ-like protein